MGESPTRAATMDATTTTASSMPAPIGVVESVELGARVGIANILRGLGHRLDDAEHQRATPDEFLHDVIRAGDRRRPRTHPHRERGGFISDIDERETPPGERDGKRTEICAREFRPTDQGICCLEDRILKGIKLLSKIVRPVRRRR